MNHEDSFSVRLFENRNAEYRVDGRLHGVRIRCNFESQEAAAAEEVARGKLPVQRDLNPLIAWSPPATRELMKFPSAGKYRIRSGI